MHRLIYLLLLVLPLSLFAQLGNGYQFEKIKPSAKGGLGVHFNKKDVYVNFQLGFFDKSNVWSAGVEYGIRPGRPVIEEKISDNVVAQYKIKRQYFGVYFEKSIYPLSFGESGKVGFTVGTGIGTQFRRYVGIKGLHSNLWLSPYAGLSFLPVENINFFLGYRYQDVNAINISKHRIGLFFSIQ